MAIQLRYDAVSSLSIVNCNKTWIKLHAYITNSNVACNVFTGSFDFDLYVHASKDIFTDVVVFSNIHCLGRTTWALG